MKKTVKQLSQLQRYLLDDDIPMTKRRHLLAQLCMDDSDGAEEMVGKLLDAAGSAEGEALYKGKLEELAAKLKELENGPLRSGTFLRMLPLQGALPRAMVLLQDGATAFVAVPDKEMVAKLTCGETVLLEGQCRAILARDGAAPFAGEEARLERRLDGDRVEVTVRDHERYILHAAADLSRKLDAEETEAGCNLMVCLRRMMAFDALPPQDGLESYRYLARQTVPDVLADRDMGSPPAYLGDLADMIDTEMAEPERRRLMGLYRCALVLLAGVSGSGKTFSIMALWRLMYEIMAAHTGVPVDELPHRVMHLRQAEVLSKWLGDSDKNLDRFFDEVEQLADEPFIDAQGRRHELPVLAIIEEVDGLARARGDEPVYDRILTTALQRLDTSRKELRDRLVIFVATTNVAQQVDHAFIRRIGGQVEHFGRLDRTSFLAVLDKQIGRRPLIATGSGPEPGTEAGASNNGQLRRRVLAEIAGGLYAPGDADSGEVELTFAGSTTPVVKRTRDFMTASLVERAVQEAAKQACRQRLNGLSSGAIAVAIRRQVRSLVGMLSERNVGDYLDLPDGVRVATLRRTTGPAAEAVELERVAVA